MLREAAEDNLDQMRAWRNQPANREVSLHAHEISREEHLAWWNTVKSDTSRKVLIAQIDDRAVGVVTYFDIDHEQSTAGWGFYLDNEGLSSDGLVMSAWLHVMSAAIDYAFDVLGVQTLTGEVLESNKAVRAMNRRFGFTEGAPEVRDIDGRRITVVPITLSGAKRRSRKAGRDLNRT